jgi:hypothetical protein
MPLRLRSPDICASSRAGAREQPHRTAVEARMHAVAVEFDFVQPPGPVRRRVDELGELRPESIPAKRSRRRVFALPAASCRKRRAVTVPAHAPSEFFRYPSATARCAIVRRLDLKAADRATNERIVLPRHATSLAPISERGCCCVSITISAPEFGLWKRR